MQKYIACFFKKKDFNFIEVIAIIAHHHAINKIEKEYKQIVRLYIVKPQSKSKHKPKSLYDHHRHKR